MQRVTMHTVRPRASALVGSAAAALGLAVITAACAGPAPGPVTRATPSAAGPETRPDGNSGQRTPDPARTDERSPTDAEAQHDGRKKALRPSQAVTGGFSAVDGDTVERGRLEVRVIGVDTPEVGQCGYEAAGAVTARFLSDGIRLTHRSGHDQYGRLLAYVVDADGRDLGTVLIRKGLANARYDSTDGYEWHPHQDRYRAIDGDTVHKCGRTADSLGGPEPFRQKKGEPFPSCAAAESVGATPLIRGDSGYNPDLDGDGDGVACE